MPRFLTVWQIYELLSCLCLYNKHTHGLLHAVKYREDICVLDIALCKSPTPTVLSKSFLVRHRARPWRSVLCLALTLLFNLSRNRCTVFLRGLLHLAIMLLVCVMSAYFVSKFVFYCILLLVFFFIDQFLFSKHIMSVLKFRIDKTVVSEIF